MRTAFKKNFTIFKDVQLSEGSEIIECFQISISGITILFVPANEYHKHLDYEIGFSCSSAKDCWNLFISRLENQNIGFRIVHENEDKWIVIDEIHGPFFFSNFPGKSQNQNLLNIKVHTTGEDYATVETVLMLIDGEIGNKIEIKNEHEQYMFESIQMRNNEVQIKSFSVADFAVEASETDISIKAKYIK
jgi:hypothetical protein